VLLCDRGEDTAMIIDNCDLLSLRKIIIYGSLEGGRSDFWFLGTYVIT
jgi:hypothetical protein